MREKLTIYAKRGCHLCDEMKAVVDRVAARLRLDVEVVDITGSAELMDRYGQEIPVLMIGGKKAAKYRVTEEELLRRLRHA